MRHAIRGSEIEVQVKENATFLDVKRAIAKQVRSDDILERGQLVTKDQGVYVGYKDHHRVGVVRSILVVCVDLSVDAPRTSSEEEEDEEEAEAEVEVKEEEQQRQQDHRGCLGESNLREEGATIKYSERVAALAGASSHVEPTLTLKQALAMQRELREGFMGETFQLNLRVLEAAYEPDSPAFVKARQNLMLSVQSRVLPRYNFEGSMIGVYKMLGACKPWVDDPEFERMGNEIYEFCGIASSVVTRRKVADTLSKLTPEPKRSISRNRTLRPTSQRLPGLELPSAGLLSMLALGELAPFGTRSPEDVVDETARSEMHDSHADSSLSVP